MTTPVSSEHKIAINFVKYISAFITNIVEEQKENLDPIFLEWLESGIKDIKNIIEDEKKASFILHFYLPLIMKSGYTGSLITGLSQVHEDEGNVGKACEKLITMTKNYHIMFKALSEMDPEILKTFIEKVSRYSLFFIDDK